VSRGRTLFDSTGPACFPDSDNLFFIAGFLNSIVANKLLQIINPTVRFLPGDIGRLPLIKLSPSVKETVNKLAKEAVEISEFDDFQYETSYCFSKYQFNLIEDNSNQLSKLWLTWRDLIDSRIRRMQELETENNRLFIEAYGLQDELTPDVPEDQITLARANRVADMKRLISYAIGCMMGRYSLDQPGLVYADSGNVGFDHAKYKSFPADDDGIIPVMDMDWFPDDGASRFEEFLKVAFAPSPQPSPASGEGALLEENLTFVADSLSQKSGETARDRIRRYISTQFFKDHMQTYKKRPIYWLFSSGKQRAFECLVYLHRYNEATLSRMRNEYVTPLQGKFAARADYLIHEIDAAATTSARNKLQKQLDVLKKKQAELAAFDDLLRHYADQRIHLDLDDGVKVNYGKFGNLLAEVRTITGGSEG
jgi:hypothetical protein